MLDEAHVNLVSTPIPMARRRSTGVAFLDDFLGGGYELDAITTVYGPPGSGKTNLALLATADAAKKGKKVVFIDTEGGFSIARLKQLVSDHKKVLENVTFLRPVTFEEQKKAFEKLSRMTDKKIHLIVVDTISMLYRLERGAGEDRFEFNRDLNAQIAKLTEITRKKRVPVLMTNQVYTSFKDGMIKMIGGDVLTYCSKCLLEIQPVGLTRRLVLKKHRSLPQGKSVSFKIVESGFDPVEKKKPTLN